MKVPLEWLSDYVALPESIEDLVYRLTMSGTEVEDVVRMGENWHDVIAGRITTLETPPGSKHLRVATVDGGDRSLIAVTGAPNVEVGQNVPVIPVGGMVPRGPEGQPFVLQPRTLMGITGDAMILSERELGISEEHAGILVLPDSSRPGRPLSEVLGGGSIDVEAKGRPDELSVLGIAREISAVTAAELRQPDLTQPDLAIVDGSAGAEVEVADPDLCNRYSAMRIDGIAVGPSPQWLVRRLETAGVRSINNVVDVTNYVMLELGQPLHAFDYHGVAQGRIVVRRSRPGESMMTLDGLERTLARDTLLITDPDGPIGIAGIMGGSASEITDATTTILLESANFDRVSIRRSARSLGLRTEASHRFERGVAPELTTIAIARCVHLLSRVMECPLTLHQLVDVRAPCTQPPEISFRLPEIERLLGIAVSLEQAMDSLRRLGFTVEVSGGVVIAVPPYWRRDVEGLADIAEEIARMTGYDRIPETLPGQDVPPAPLPPELVWENAVRETLWGLGLTEAWTNSLTSPEALRRLFPATTIDDPDWERMIVNPHGVATHGTAVAMMALMNAPTRERSVLRISLLPALLEVVARNLKHTRNRVAFFELARTFFPRPDDLPYERRTLAVAMAGYSEPRSWNRPEAQYDFFDLKGVVAALLERMGYRQEEIQFKRTDEGSRNPALHPGRSAHVLIRDGDVGHVGELHPSVAGQFEVEPPVRAYVAELDLDALIAGARSGSAYRPFSRYPAIHRDISMLFPAGVAAAEIERIAWATGGELLRHAHIVDVYQDGSVGTDHTSIAIALEFQSDAGTLTQEQATTAQEAIVRRLEAELMGELRS